MTSRKIRNAENFAAQHLTRVGLSGSYVVVDGSTWYGPYSTIEAARDRIGRRDSLDMTIRGVAVQVP